MNSVVIWVAMVIVPLLNSNQKWIKSWYWNLPQNNMNVYTTLTTYIFTPHLSKRLCVLKSWWARYLSGCPSLTLSMENMSNSQLSTCCKCWVSATDHCRVFGWESLRMLQSSNNYFLIWCQTMHKYLKSWQQSRRTEVCMRRVLHGYQLWYTSYVGMVCLCVCLCTHIPAKVCKMIVGMVNLCVRVHTCRSTVWW